MSLAPLLAAPWIIQLHAFGAVAAILLGAIQFFAPKGTLPHKVIGAAWLLVMAVIATSSIFIRPSIHPGLPFFQWFSLIHIFTVLTFGGIMRGTYFLLKGGPNLKFHKKPFTGIFIGGLIVAGALAFLPGRIMHQVMFGG